MNEAINILLVDDELRNLDVLEAILRSSDYRLVRARTADEALMALLDEEFATIVLDIQMPEMNGLELANLIKQRKRTQHVPIIFLTAYFHEEREILQGYEVGAVEYLTKPVSPQILRSKIAVFVDLFRKTRDLAETNRALEMEVAERQKAQDELRRMNAELETRVRERTADLLRVNSEVTSARDAAERASLAKDDFLAKLSHELRTPLNPVLLLASEAADNEALPADVRSDFAVILKNVELEARLIDDLLDLTRITHGKLSLDLHPIEIDSVLRDAIATFRGEIEQKKLQLTVQFDSARPLIMGDPVRLRQIFWNVLGNSAKFTPPSGSISVETRSDPESGKFVAKITDSGIGMTRDELDRLFNVFSQGEDASRRFGGLGLGLAISRMLVELQGGTIQADSAGPGLGASFRIEFPLAPCSGANGNPANAVAAIQKHAHPAPARRRVLLVEDHEPTRATLTQLLKRRGYEVTSVGTVAAARMIASQTEFDLLISDIGLPDGNGYELIGELRKIREIKAIALTGYGMEQDILRSQGAGFLTHLTKPVRIQTLDTALALASAHPSPLPP